MEPLYVRSSLLEAGEYARNGTKGLFPTPTSEPNDTESTGSSGAEGLPEAANVGDFSTAEVSAESSWDLWHAGTEWNFWQSYNELHALGGYGPWGPWPGAQQSFMQSGGYGRFGEWTEGGVAWPGVEAASALGNVGAPCPPPPGPPPAIEGSKRKVKSPPPVTPPDRTPACPPTASPRVVPPPRQAKLNKSWLLSSEETTSRVSSEADAEGVPVLKPPDGLLRANSTPLSTPDALPDPLRHPPGLERAKSSPAALPPQSAAIEHSMSPDGKTIFVNWTVDARKLKVKDKVAVSPAFEMSDSIVGTFRIMLYPKTVSDRKGGASFKKAKGKGSVHIKCESPIGEVYDGSVSLSIVVMHPNKEDLARGLRGPVIHSFADNGICSLPKHEEEWDFSEATDVETQNFVVSLLISKQVEGAIKPDV